jgi:hypothetical protein
MALIINPRGLDFTSLLYREGFKAVLFLQSYKLKLGDNSIFLSAEIPAIEQSGRRREEPSR